MFLLQPVLANNAHCYICARQELVDALVSERTIVHVDVDVSGGALYECSTCWEIVHPYCMLQRQIKREREDIVKKEKQDKEANKIEEIVGLISDGIAVKLEDGAVKLEDGAVKLEDGADELVVVTAADVEEVVMAQQYREAFVNEDLPSSWECPKCCCQEKVIIGVLLDSKNFDSNSVQTLVHYSMNGFFPDSTFQREFEGNAQSKAGK